MAKVYITRKIPDDAKDALVKTGHEVFVSEKEGILTREELLGALKEHQPQALISQLTDTIDAEVFEASPQLKICANYAVGFNNIDVEDATARGIVVTNTPDVLTDTVAEHAVAMMLSITSRITEGDRFVRAGRYSGWAPLLLLGTDMKGATLGVVGAGRIGRRMAEIARNGLGMNILYTDIVRNEDLEKSVGAVFEETIEDLLPKADVVTLHVPLLDSTRHLMNSTRLSMMKPSSYLINAARGPIVDEDALVSVLKEGKIRGAALDVYENEPKLANGLDSLENVVLTPHLCSASETTRSSMATLAADNVIAVLGGKPAPNQVAK